MKKFLSILLISFAILSLFALPAFAYTYVHFSPIRTGTRANTRMYIYGGGTLYITDSSDNVTDTYDFDYLRIYVGINGDERNVSIPNVMRVYLDGSYTEFRVERGFSFFFRSDSAPTCTIDNERVPIEDYFTSTIYSNTPSVFGFVRPFLKSITVESIFPFIFGSFLVPISFFVIVRRLNRV